MPAFGPLPVAFATATITALRSKQLGRELAIPADLERVIHPPLHLHWLQTFLSLGARGEEFSSTEQGGAQGMLLQTPYTAHKTQLRPF